MSQLLSKKVHNQASVNSISSQTSVANRGGLSNLGNLMSNSGKEVQNSTKPEQSPETRPSSQGYPTSSPTIPTSNPGITLKIDSGNPGKETSQTSQALSSTKPGQQIFGSIAKENNANTKDYSKVIYGNDASVVITEKNIKSKNSLGRYSSTLTESSPSSTKFGTVIGGVPVNGQSKFDVIKPSNSSENQNSNVRSKLRKHIHKKIQKP